MGVPEVQLHEPSLTTDAGAAAEAVYTSAYTALAAVGCPIDLVTYYDDLGEAYPWVITLPVSAISLDFCGVPGDAAGNATLALIRKHGFPASKRLGAGIIDARSPYADDLPACAAVLAELQALGVTNISIQPSTTLQHLPYDTAAEAGHLDPALLSKLSFAVQKLGALSALATGGVSPAGADVALAWGLPPDGANLAHKCGALPGVDPALLSRPEVFEERRPKQPQFHAFPTSTIGSFPQTAEVMHCLLFAFVSCFVFTLRWDACFVVFPGGGRERWVRKRQMKFQGRTQVQCLLKLVVSVHPSALSFDLVVGVCLWELKCCVDCVCEQKRSGHALCPWGPSHQPVTALCCLFASRLLGMC
jgi:hypothetical protein